MPIRMTAVRLHQAFRAGELSAGDIAAAFGDRIRAVDPEVKAFLRVDEGDLRSQAEALDARRRRGGELGPLAGVPVALKDNISQSGVPATCGSRLLEHYVPPYDAHAVERLRAAGALLLGRTNMDEFAMGSTTETSAFFPTRNPWALDRVPGGSSGGSAAAVAARLAPVALGSDTGGSVRQPAALCGVYGLKPTYGRVSRFGLVAYGSSLDQIGPLARDPGDLALVLGVIAGRDGRDSTSSARPVDDYAAAVDRGVEGLRAGLPREYFGAGVEPDVRARVEAGIERLESLGLRTTEVSLPHQEQAISTYYLIATSEASSNLARFDGVHYGRRAPEPRDLFDLYARSRGEGFGHEVKKRIVLGTFALSAGYHEAYYRRAQQVRTLIRRELEQVFQQVDVLLCPTSPTAACPLGSVVEDPLAMYMMDVMTVSANLAGLPGLSLPCGFTHDALPVGLQVLGRPFREADLFRVAGALAAATDHHRREPAL